MNKFIDAIIKSYPILTQQETKALCERIKQGDIEARNTLALSNIRLILKIFSGMHVSRNEAEDMFQECFVTYLEKAHMFDPDKGTFATYMSNWVKDTIRNNNTHCIPVKSLNEYSKIRKAEEAFLDAYERMPTDKELSDATGLSVNVINKRRSDRNVFYMDSLDRSVKGKDGSTTTLGSLIDYGDYEDPEEDCINAGMIQDMFSQIACLSEREQMVLDCLYNLSGKYDTPLSIRETAQETGIGRMTVAAIRDKALAKLRRRMGYTPYNSGLAA